MEDAKIPNGITYKMTLEEEEALCQCDNFRQSKRVKICYYSIIYLKTNRLVELIMLLFEPVPSSSKYLPVNDR